MVEFRQMFLPTLVEGAQNSSPLVLVLILGVFAKVLKTPPPNFEHLESLGRFGGQASVAHPPT